MKTKSGLPITFTTVPDSEKENRGWQVDKITAFVDGVEAGYLKISYIPQANLARFYPSILNYMTQIQGSSLMPYEKKRLPWQDLTLEEKRSLIARLRWERLHRENLEELARTLPDDAIDPLIETLVAKLEQSDKGKSFDDFKAFHIDKPLVDYIRVYDENSSPTGKSFQRDHIGLALYQEGAAYLATQGLHLWASGIQSDDAQHAWAKMETLGWVSTVGKRRILTLPQLAMAA